ncbi:MAG: SprB repeat-containing protein [Ferruginibacter sp.]
MKLIKLIMLFIIGSFAVSNAVGQANAYIQVLTLNSGQVAVGATVDIQVTVGNSGPTSNILANNVRTQVSVPAPGVTILANGLQTGIPAGWVITSNNGTTIQLCNGTDVITPGTQRNVLIKVQGVSVQASQTVSGGLTFRSGSNCSAPGSLSGNNTADDNGTSSIQVIAASCNITGATATLGTPIACFGGTTSLTVNATGSPLGTLEYSVNGGAYQLSNVFTVNAAGSPYIATVREVANISCNATATAVTVSQPTAITASAAAPAVLCNGGTTTLTVTASGGTGTLQYSLNGGAYQSGNTFIVNAAGSPYVVTVRDANLCTGTTASVAVSQPSAITASAAAGTILCNAGTTTLTVTASGGTGTLQYSLNGGAYQLSNAFTVNAAGSPYTVTVKDANNCTVNAAAVSVSQPAAIVFSGSVTTPIAVPGGQGTITVAGTGGTGTISYVITAGTTINTTGASSGIFTNLLAGSYTFTATDANSCSATTTVILANPGAALADPAVGQMYFTTTGGSVQSANTLLLAPAPDLYDINVPFYNLNQLNEVPNGTINLRVNLGSKLVLAPAFNLGTAPLSTYFSWAQSVVGGNVILTGTQIASIPADFNATAIFRVKGDSACRSNVVSNIVITNLLQTLNDDDVNNNSATLQYTLPITLTNTQVNVTCNGAGNGIINVTVSSGTTVVTTGPSGYTNTQNIASGVNNFTLTGLIPGTYTITSTATSDAPLLSCSQVATVIITQPTTLTLASSGSVNNTCFGGTAGSITVVAAGGTAPYTYSIAGPTVNTTGASSGVFTNLAAGSYTVTVTDNNGCTAPVGPIVITQPVGGLPDITLGSDYTGNLFLAPGVSQTIVYNVAEINGSSAVGDTLRITKPAGFTITFNPTLFSTTVGATTYTLDNTRWKIDNSNPAFVSIILTDPLNAANPGTLLCNQLVRVAVTLTRNTSNISNFPLSARLRKANGEANLNNNLNSIIMSAE